MKFAYSFFRNLMNLLNTIDKIGIVPQLLCGDCFLKLYSYDIQIYFNAHISMFFYIASHHNVYDIAIYFV